MTIRLIAKSVWDNPGNRGKRLRKTFAAIVWQLQKRCSRSSSIMKLPNGVLFKIYPDCVVSSALVYADWPDYHELMFLRRTLRHHDIVLDVGAHAGHISSLLGDVVAPGNIVAFEPTPISFRRLEENWQLNGWQADGLMQVAVGAKTGHVYMHDVSRPVTTNTVTDRPVFQDFVQVPLVCLDDLRHLWAERSIGLLKIDVEGYESEVFRGSRQLLRQNRPRVIMFESLSQTLDDDVGTLLSDCAYIVFQLDAEGRPDFATQTAQNLFAIPEEYRVQFGC